MIQSIASISPHHHNRYPFRSFEQITKPNSSICRIAVNNPKNCPTVFQNAYFSARQEGRNILHTREKEEEEEQDPISSVASTLEMSVRLKSLALGKQTHALIIKTGNQENMFFQTKLVLMYCKCGSLIDAHLVFDRIQYPDVFCFTPMIAEYVNEGYFEESLALFQQMHKACVRQDDLIFTSVVKAFAGLGALKKGKEIHGHVIKCGFEGDVFVGSCLLDMYGKCKSVEDAWKVFERMPRRSRVSWTSMISGFAKNGQGDVALKVLRQMKLGDENSNVKSWTALIAGYEQNGCWDVALEMFTEMRLANVEPNTNTLAIAVQACGRLGDVKKGMQIHGFTIRRGFYADVFVGNALVGMYTSCRKIDIACQVFKRMPRRNVVSWNMLLAAYTQNGLLNEAMDLFDQMQWEGVKPNLVSLNTSSTGCTQNGRRDKVSKFFSDLQLNGVRPNVVSWTTMISGYAQNGYNKEALKLFWEMLQAGVKPSSNTIAGVMRACTDLKDLQQGKVIHAYILRRGLESSVFVGTALVDMYAKCGNVSVALVVFHQIPHKNVVTWNSIIRGYTLRGLVDDALKLFAQMQLKGMKPDAFTWSIMITGYVQNGQVEEALKFFSQMQVEGIKPSIISWTALIAGYARNGQGNEALKLFNQMQLAGEKPNLVSIATVLPACASLAALKQGKQIHGYSIRNGFQSDVVAGSALVDMYAKCGSIKYACQVFDKMLEKNLITWNSMITGYAVHGNGKAAISLFHDMVQEGIKPDSITFTGLLSACSHSGLLDEGWQYFDIMSQDYGITPNLTHYACVVDLLGRCGYLDEAWDFIEKMPFEPDVSVWGALLSACQTHSNVEIGELAAKHLFQLEPDNGSNYTLLSNIYALAGKRDDLISLREVMKDMGIKKRLGWSSIQVKNKVHTFSAGGSTHPQIAEIRENLQDLFHRIREAGYVPDTSCVLLNLKEEEKEHILQSHSAKLAMAFGLSNSYPGTPLLIIRNLRMCVDCHTAAKFISKIANREISIRDRNRFHHFKDGLCSCGDHW